MQCQWALAAATPAGGRILANGPGAYGLGSQAGEWRTEFNRAFARLLGPAGSSTVPIWASSGHVGPAREASGGYTDHGHRAAGGHRQPSATGPARRRARSTPAPGTPQPTAR